MGIAGIASISALVGRFLNKRVTQGRLDSIHDFIAYWIAFPGDLIGLALNSAGTQLPLIGKAWNKTFEPLVIIVLRTIGSGIIDGVKGLIDNIIKALQSDNPSTKD